MGHITLVTGGAKSGKSAFAEQLAEQSGGRLGYIATAQAGDEEMRQRIIKHQERRDSRWQTLEEPLRPSTLITAGETRSAYDVLLLDCLTVLISNILLSQPLNWDAPTPDALLSLECLVMAEIEALARAAENFSGHLIMVTNEVGFGIVPLSPLARFFRDCAGRTNQRLAARADSVYLVVAGLPLCLKQA